MRWLLKACLAAAGLGGILAWSGSSGQELRSGLEVRSFGRCIDDHVVRMAAIGNRIRDCEQFVGGEDFVDVKNQAKFLSECSHAEQVFGLDTSAKRRSLFDFISGKIDDLAHRV